MVKSDLFPFSKLNNEHLILTLKCKNIKFVKVVLKQILEKPSFSRSLGFKLIQVHKMKKMLNITRYFSRNELKVTLKRENFLKAFYLNILSLPYHIYIYDNLQILMSQQQLGLESKETKKQILKYQSIKMSSALQKVLMAEHCFIIKYDTIYKVRNGLKMNNSKNIESIFIECYQTNI